MNRHPVTLALAIKTLLRTSVFAPAPAELLAALEEAATKLGKLSRYAREWLETMMRTDAIVFAFARGEWDSAYAGVPSSVPEAMLRHDPEPPDEDEDGTAIAPSPRWAALTELRERKQAAELAAAPESKRLAACAARAPKRTRAPKDRDG
jgi:hypothetical protein